MIPGDEIPLSGLQHDPVRIQAPGHVGRCPPPPVLEGRDITVRYKWSGITATTARWEQAFSPDNGQTWETNWTADFTRAG